MTPDVDYEDPATVPAAVRAAGLVGREVVARPNGPMGPAYTGTALGWGYSRGSVLVDVETDDGEEFDCFVQDVEAVNGDD